MAKAKAINADEMLKNAEEIVLPPLPMVYDVPEGYPPLRAGDGDSWFERAINYEKMTGRKVLPLKYRYDEDGNIVLRETEPKENEDGTSDK